MNKPTPENPKTAPLSAVVEPAPLVRLGGLLDALSADAAERHAANLAGRAIGPVSGLAALDKLLGGAFLPGLHVLHGSPGVGKTAFALSTAALCGSAALFVTCEMAPMELLRRHTARVTRTYLGKLKSGELPASEVLALARRACATAPNVALLDATTAPAPPAVLLHAAELCRDFLPVENGGRAHLLIVIDSLHSWADSLGAEAEEYDRLNFALSELRLLSKRLDCPVLAIAERNRGSMKGGGQSAGAGSRKIEYGAETVIELDADADGKEHDGEKPVKLTISKNRNGTTGRLDLLFNGGFQSHRKDF